MKIKINVSRFLMGGGTLIRKRGYANIKGVGKGGACWIGQVVIKGGLKIDGLI